MIEAPAAMLVRKRRGLIEIELGDGKRVSVDEIVDAEAMGRCFRLRWSVEAKGRVVAESYVPGAVVLEVTRRHEIAPQHLFAWRKAARSGLLALPVDAAAFAAPEIVAAHPVIGDHSLRWPITGSTAARRRISRRIALVTRRPIPLISQVNPHSSRTTYGKCPLTHPEPLKHS